MTRPENLEPLLLQLILLGQGWFLQDPKDTQSLLDLDSGLVCERSLSLREASEPGLVK